MTEPFQSKSAEAINDTLSIFREDQSHLEGDERFTQAMIAAGYTPHVHTAPCTDNPRVWLRPVTARPSRSVWDSF